MAFYDHPLFILDCVLLCFTLWEKCDCCTPKQKSTYIFILVIQKRVSYIHNVIDIYISMSFIHNPLLPQPYTLAKYIQRSHNNNIISIVFGISNHMISVVSKIVQIAFHFCRLYILYYTITLIYNKNRSHLLNPSPS